MNKISNLTFDQEIKKKIKLMPNRQAFLWSEFYERYVVNFEEFDFLYNNEYFIRLSYGDISPDGCYNFGIIFESKQGIIERKTYASPQELLDKTRINGKTLQEIWDDLR